MNTPLLNVIAPTRSVAFAGDTSTQYHEHQAKDLFEMLMHEELARARIRELHQEASAQPPPRRRPCTTHRWNRMARWLANRPHRAER